MKDDLVHDIVIAEDDYGDVEIFKLALNEASIEHELRHAENGNILFVLLKERIPYLLFLDVEMPCKDGISCIREIRQDSRYDMMPVIIYSSHINSRYIDDSFRHGANLYLSKRENINKTVEDLKRIFSVDWTKGISYPGKDDYLVT